MKAKTDQSCVRIAVMGVTGAGKSTLIKTITGRDDVAIGEGLKSQTTSAASYSVTISGIEYILIDTPGFNDTKRTDQQILNHVVDYLSTEYKQNKLLTGIIYLHPIGGTRVPGSMMRQIRVFKELCGKDSLGNVLIGTTKWENVVDSSWAVREEKELLDVEDGYLTELVDFGASIVRVSQNKDECLGLLEWFANKQERALKIQEVMAGPEVKIENTEVAKILAPELSQLTLEHERRVEEERQREKQTEEQNRRRLEHIAQLQARKAEKEKERLLEEKRQEELRLQQQALDRERQRSLEILAEKRRQEVEQEKRKLEAIAAERRREEAEIERKQKAEALRKAKEDEERKEQERQKEEARKVEEARRVTERQKKEMKRKESCSETRKSLKLKGGYPWSTSYTCWMPDCSTKTDEYWECWSCKNTICKRCYRNWNQILLHNSDCSWYEPEIEDDSDGNNKISLQLGRALGILVGSYWL